MLKIKFKYRDKDHNYKWCVFTCYADSVEECKKIYNLDDQDKEYEILSIEDST